MNRFAKLFGSLHRYPEILRCVRRSDAWPALIGGYLGLRPLRFPREFRTPYGDRMTLETFHDLVTVWVVFFRDEYPVDLSHRRIIDAGANIGSFSLLAARVAPEARIIALEPFPATRARREERPRVSSGLPALGSGAFGRPEVHGRRQCA